LKKLLEKDKRIRKKFKKLENFLFVLKMIQNNLTLPHLVRFNASHNLNKTSNKISKTLISNRCLVTVNKRKFSKLTNFSRIFTLKLARNKKIYGLVKASW